MTMPPGPRGVARAARGAAAGQDGLRRALRRMPRRHRQRRRRVGRVSGAAAARLHHRQIQDPLDRDRQRADRRRPDRSVQRGLYGTAMPGWDRILSGRRHRRRRAATSSRCRRSSPQPPKPVAIGDGVPSSPDSIARGRQVYDKLQCGKCHGTDGRGTGAVTTTFEDDWRKPLRAADLTEPWTFHGGATSRDIYLRFRTGMTGTPMPSFADAASDAEMWDLANYVVSLGAQAGLVDDRGRGHSSSTRSQEADAKADPVEARRSTWSRRSAACCATRRSTSRSACCPA